MAGAAPPPAASNSAQNIAFLQAYSADPSIVPSGAGHQGPATPEEVETARLQGGKERPKGHKSILDEPEQPEGAPEITPRNIQPVELANRIPNAVRGLPEIGGLVFPLLVLLLFFFLILKTNGKSRWEWFWDVLTGNAAVQTSAAKTAAQSAVAAGGILEEPDPQLKAAFTPNDNVTELKASSYQPHSFLYTPSNAISVTGAPS